MLLTRCIRDVRTVRVGEPTGNPAVTIARTLTDTFAGIRPSAVALFVLAQLIGGVLAVALARFLHPTLPAAADEVVLPHDQA